MIKKCGNLYTLQVEHPSYGWVSIGGQRSTSASVSNEQVETYNKDEMPWKILSKCGTRSISLKCSGIVNDHSNMATEVFSWLNTKATEQDLISVRILSGPFSEIYKGYYLLSTFERSSEYSSVELYSVVFESAGSLEKTNLPLFNAFTPAPGFAIGWSVRVLSMEHYNSGRPCMRIRRQTDNIETDIYFNSDLYCDITAIETFLNGAVGRVVKFYDQGPDEQKYPNNTNVPKFNLSQTDPLRQPYITDLSGNLFLNSNGFLEIGINFNDTIFGNLPGIGLLSQAVDWGNPAGNIDSGYIGAVCRTLKGFSGGNIVGTTSAFTLMTSGSVSSPGYEFRSDGTPNPFIITPFPDTQQRVVGGITSDIENKGLLLDAKYTNYVEPSNQSYGAVTISLGVGGVVSFKGFISEVFMYLERQDFTTPGFLETTGKLIQINQANSMGIVI